MSSEPTTYETDPFAGMVPDEADEVAASLLERVPQWVDNRAQYENAGAVLRDVKTELTRLHDTRMEITRHMDDAKRGVMALFAPRQEALKAAEDSIKQLMAAYQQAEDKRVEEARAALEAEAMVAAEDGRYEDAEAKHAERDSAEPEYRRRDARGFKPAYGVTSQDRWYAQVVAFELLVQAVADGRADISLLLPDRVALDQLARRVKDQDNPPPGVRFMSKRSIAAAGR